MLSCPVPFYDSCDDGLWSKDSYYNYTTKTMINRLKIPDNELHSLDVAQSINESALKRSAKMFLYLNSCSKSVKKWATWSIFSVIH